MSKSSLADVDDSKDTWSVVAKVIRKWVVRKKAAPYPIWKIGMILADEMDTRMEVSATHKTVIPSLLAVPKEGIVYNFQNFEVVENDDKYRATTNPWRLNFHNHTYIEESDVVINQEGYNFKSIVDVKHSINTDEGLIAFGRLQDQTRESDITKRLNFSIGDENENIINITLWGQCAEETYAKKHEDMEPSVIVPVRFARTNRNTDYGHLSNAFNATLVTLNPKIPEASSLKERLSQDSTSSQLFSQISSLEYPTYSAESLLNFRTRITLSDISKLDQECDVVSKVTIKKCETLYGWFYDACPCDKKPEYMPNGTLRCTKCEKDVLMTVPKYKIHYKVVDETGKASIIFFDRHATELLGKSASMIKENMHKEGRNTTIPKELDEIAGKVVIVRLRIRSHNIKHRTSSIGVSQLCADTHLVQQFQYSNVEGQTTSMLEESTASRKTGHTSSQINVIEDEINFSSHLTTPSDSNTKRKNIGTDAPIVCEDLGLAEMCTPKMSTRKPLKNIKKEK